jgi:hypothetical protein
MFSQSINSLISAGDAGSVNAPLTSEGHRLPLTSEGRRLPLTFGGASLASDFGGASLATPGNDPTRTEESSLES